ncbi:MAG: DUF1015 domain-containing protein, partial [Deltaproteobacteria bacterium]|nr:DUF1015 domain-containing protein [Deltaproteobacteria bacterium]
VKLILNKTEADDNPGSDRYSRSAELLQNWLEDESLKRDGKESLYYYEQSYKTKDGAAKSRKGFIARVKIEELGKGVIFPHEKTLSGPKKDRLSLMETCKTNYSCIFSLFNESKDLPLEERVLYNFNSALNGPPQIEVTGDDGVLNKLWVVDDPAVISGVSSAMEDKKLYIADGHHRYETALNYRNKKRAEGAGEAPDLPHESVLMYLTPMDETLEVYPTHRVVHALKDVELGGAFLKVLDEYFNTEVLDFTEKNESYVRSEFLEKLKIGEEDHNKLGLTLNGESRYVILTLKGKEVMDKVFGDSIGSLYKALDVTVLHSLVLGKLLGISIEAQEKKTNLIYVKDADEAIELANAEENQLAFIMNATSVEDVKQISDAGLLMPQKSTYFFPKLLSGVVINPLWD